MLVSLHNGIVKCGVFEALVCLLVGVSDTEPRLFTLIDGKSSIPLDREDQFKEWNNPKRQLKPSQCPAKE